MSFTSPRRCNRIVTSLPRGATFAAAAAGLIFVFMISGAPIPLMNVYRERGLGTTDFAHASVLYFVAAALGLLCLGRLSVWCGRRWASVAALLVGSAGCVMMVDVQSAADLALGRGLQGLACGMAPGALGSWIVDSAGPRGRLSAVVTGSAPMIGLPLGALASGALVESGLLSTQSVFVLLAVLAVALAVLLAWGTETVQHRGAVLAVLRPRLTVPRSARRPLAVAMAVLVATWPLGSFYQAYGSIVAADLLGSGSILVAGAIFASIMILNPVGGSLSGLISSRASVIIGLSGFGVALAVAMVALWHGSAVVFTVGSLSCGLFQGAGATGSMRLLLPRVRPADRAGALATIYFVAFGSVAVCSVAGGWVATGASLKVVAICYATFGWLAILGGVLLAVRGADAEHAPVDPPADALLPVRT